VRMPRRCIYNKVPTDTIPVWAQIQQRRVAVVGCILSGHEKVSRAIVAGKEWVLKKGIRRAAIKALRHAEKSLSHAKAVMCGLELPKPMKAARS
jgi:hypothetical protein